MTNYFSFFIYLSFFDLKEQRYKKQEYTLFQNGGQ